MGEWRGSHMWDWELQALWEEERRGGWPRSRGRKGSEEGVISCVHAHILYIFIFQNVDNIVKIVWFMYECQVWVTASSGAYS